MSNFNKNIKKEIIVLSHLQNLYDNNLSKSIYDFSGWPKTLKKESLKKYVKIDEKKVKELENKFITYKNKAVFKKKIKIDDTKIYEISERGDYINIYENKHINKLFNVQFFFECDFVVKGDLNILSSYHGPEICESLDIHGPKIEIPILPEPKINVPSLDKKGPKIDMPILPGPKINVPSLDIDGPKIDKPILPGPKINVPSLDIKEPKIDKPILPGTKINIPNLDIIEINKIPKCIGVEEINTSRYYISIIGLDNQDLILLYREIKHHNFNTNTTKNDYSKERIKISIYRLEHKKYLLFQEFNADNIDIIKKLSENRFISISKSKVEIYSLNKGNKYSIVKYFNISDICQFHEFKKNNFIFCAYYFLEKKSDFKIFYCNELLFEYSINREEIYFSDFIVLKNKYGIIVIDNNLLIINILKNKIIKRYILLYYDDDNLIILKNYKIKKWNTINDNEFLLIINGNITLFKLNDKFGINLEILAYYYFNNIDDLIKVDENNRFCLIKDENNYNNIYFY